LYECFSVDRDKWKKYSRVHSSQLSVNFQEGVDERERKEEKPILRLLGREQEKREKGVEENVE
jgi:hypothetical protein